MTKRFLFCYLFCFASTLFSEEVVTTKKEEPDGYYGLKLGAIVTPTFSYRIRDKASGTTDLSPSDRSGFSLPWTLFFVSKEWQETGVKVEFWGEILRGDAISQNTSTDGGNRSNPYLFAIRRANVSKTWNLSSTKHTLQFGMFELPHMFSVWSGYYDWRYIDRSPLESLGFAKDPVDLGLNYVGSWKSLSLQLATVNGEGYRSVQNVSGTGFDGIVKLSWEEKWTDSFKTGLHLLGRRANAFGNAGDECREGKTNCLPSDSDPNTRKKGSLSLSMENVWALEANVIYREYVNFGIGGLAKKQLGGEIRDLNQPFAFAEKIPERIGRGGYLWLGLGNKTLRLVFRGEVGTGGPTPGVRATETTEQEPWVRFKDPRFTDIYSDKSYYVQRQVFGEWFAIGDTRLAIGYSETLSYDRRGEPNKWYVDSIGEVRNRVQYEAEIQSPTQNPISVYGRLDRNLIFKATTVF
ncbi:MAG: hypothetical protein O9301_08955 [Leptospira sp.]|nr:hypothetical protein [Leptospira sp.]